MDTGLFGYIDIWKMVLDMLYIAFQVVWGLIINFWYIWLPLIILGVIVEILQNKIYQNNLFNMSLTNINIEVCPICRKPYTQKYPKEKYHLQYEPYGEFIYACGKCNYAEYLSRRSHGYLMPWLWKRLWLVKKFARENPHLKD